MTGPGSARVAGRERLTRALAADLRDLAVDLEAGSCTRATLGMLRRDLAQVVPSSLGASVRVELDRVPGVPVQIDLAARRGP